MSGRAIVWLAALAASVSVAAGLRVVGSPATARERSLDERRLEDLYAIINAVEMRRWSTGRLPAGLSDLNDLADTRLRDPLTGAAYEYSVVGNDRYQLCAVFQQSSSADGLRHHRAGRHCFDRAVPPKPGWLNP